MVKAGLEGADFSLSHGFIVKNGFCRKQKEISQPAFYGRYLEVHRVVNSYKATNMTGGPPKAIHSRSPGPWSIAPDHRGTIGFFFTIPWQWPYNGHSYRGCINDIPSCITYLGAIPNSRALSQLFPGLITCHSHENCRRPKGNSRPLRTRRQQQWKSWLGDWTSSWARRERFGAMHVGLSIGWLFVIHGWH